MPVQGLRVCARFRVPESNGPIRTPAGKHMVINRTEGRTQDSARMAGQPGFEFPCGGVPQVQQSILVPLANIQPSTAQYARLSTADRCRNVSVIHREDIPQENRVVTTATGKCRPVRIEDSGQYTTRMPH